MTQNVISRRELLRGVSGSLLASMISSCKTTADVSHGKKNINPADVEQIIRERGYNIIGKKLSPETEEYVIILPERHGFTNKYAVEFTTILADSEIFSRIGLENYIGEEGEDLVVKTEKFKEELYRKWPTLFATFIEHGDSDFQKKYYGNIPMQKFKIKSYGLDEPKLMERSLVAYMLGNVQYLVLFYEDSAEESSKIDKQRIANEIKGFESGLKFLGLELPECARTNGKDRDDFVKRLQKIYYPRITVHDRNAYFLSRIKSEDLVIVGVAHAYGLMQGYRGNVFIVNPVKGNDPRSASLRSILDKDYIDSIAEYYGDRK